MAIPLPDGGRLLALEDRPPVGVDLRGLVVLVHGLAGDSGRQGVRRLALVLQRQGFAVWRLNLRGAGPGRPLARGTYAAACNADLGPVLAQARQRACGQPLLGVGLSLGGTVLLNTLLEQPTALDRLACVSSPLDLEACSRQIAAPRNRLYAHWLLQRLIAQTRADPFGLTAEEEQRLRGNGRPRSLRAFDALITAPRWGYGSLTHYYRAASPLPALLRGAPLPPCLLLQAADDPWVPAAAAWQLAAFPSLGLEVIVCRRGGHNGFHGAGAQRNWADQRVASWLQTPTGAG